ncbi:MAG: polysaccharide biosynthesis protein [Candidatus Desulfofervidus auxilii]|nr:polysaccharide biosynthesis protein [Candidatus Desulfofervidus auxilii]
MIDFSYFSNKIILITGAAGTVGKELIRQLLKYKPAEIRLLDNNETEIFFLMEKYKYISFIKCFLGDIRDKDRMKRIMKCVDIVFHTAAFKHVILSEYHPFDVIQTNILATQNIIEAALENNVEKVIFTSSDKAVNPTNVMGASKLMCEKLITAANTLTYGNKTIFVSVRFGNIIGSRGSVVPVFMNQIKLGGPVTVTDKRMTRFIMTVEQAANLILKAALLAKGGEVFITKMPVMRIIDLAEVMIDILAPKYGYSPETIEIKEIGAKPGEKLYEELMNEEEKKRSLELKDMFVTLPAFKDVYKIEYSYPQVVREQIDKAYNSANEIPLTKNQLKDYLIKNRILEKVEGEIL